jgi:hypothetical protein
VHPVSEASADVHPQQGRAHHPDGVHSGLPCGSTDPDVYAKAKVESRLNQIPTNHNPRFLPVLRPTLEVGVETLMVAARAWLSAAR